ncbi:MAG TPA: hypothetical protein PLD12_03330 [Bacteroidales bacterium]|nr:hypothetical protein [Bacteroidales bacterium]HPO64897.1 hypothetical protein [Bacteroidales bacterium]
MSIHIMVYGVLMPFLLHGQQQEEKYNLVPLKKGQRLVSENRVIEPINDTVVKIPVTEDYVVLRTKSDSNFFDFLKDKAYRRKWTKEIHNIIIKSPATNDDVLPILKMKNTEASYLIYNQSFIRKIKIRKVKVFGATLDDPDREPRYFLGKIGNKVHVYTRDWVIRKFFLFREGEKFDAYSVTETERILREQPYIEDVRINIYPINASADSVDIEIMVKDNWSKGVSASTANLQDLYLNVWDNNLLGTGQTFDNEYFIDDKILPHRGINGYYHINNIFGSFVNCRISYDAFGNQGYGVRLWRDFFTQTTRYAGELLYEDKNLQYTRLYNDTMYNWRYYPLRYRQLNTWVGRAFPVLSGFFTSYSNLSYAAGMYYRHFYERPYVSQQYRYQLHNRTFFLNSITFSSIGHYKSNLIYSYGRTEDIPYGILINYTTGLEYNEFSRRSYHSVSTVMGNNIGQLGFGYFNAALGGFVRQNTWEQSVFKINLYFFSNLLVAGRYKARNFVSIGYVKGFNRNVDEKLNINNFSGVRGFFNDTALGNKKLTLNFETVLFTPFKINDFRFAFFGFVDLAWIDYLHSRLLENPMFSGIGIGVRMRNERLVIKTFQLRLVYYPNIRPTTIGDLFVISPEWRLRTPDMNIKSPQIIEYQ